MRIYDILTMYNKTRKGKMKKILGISLCALFAVSAANADIASKLYVDQEVGANTSSINTLTDRVDGHNTAITNLQGTVNRLGTAAYKNIDDFATGAEGDLAASAVQAGDVTTGTNNGTINVKGNPVAVKGLGTAAYTDSSAYAAAALTETVSTNTTNIGSLTNRVNETESGIASLTTRVNGTESDIGSLTNTVNEHGQNISNNADAITANGALISENTNKINTNTQAINANKQSITELSGTVNEHTTAITNLQTKTTNLKDLAYKNTVATADIDASAVTETQIKDSAVTTNKIGANAVTSAKILDGAVTKDKIDASAVATEKIADNAVTTAKIKDGTITNADIADGTIETGKINFLPAQTNALNSGITNNLVAQIGNNKDNIDAMLGEGTGYDTCKRSTNGCTLVVKGGSFLWEAITRADGEVEQE